MRFSNLNGCPCTLTNPYWPSCVRVARTGALEIPMSPPNGAYISRIKNIAPETDNPATSKAVITVALCGANSQS